MSSRPITITAGSKIYVTRPRYAPCPLNMAVIAIRKMIMNKPIMAIVAPIKEIQFCEECGNLNFITLPF